MSVFAACDRTAGLGDAERTDKYGARQKPGDHAMLRMPKRLHQGGLRIVGMALLVPNAALASDMGHAAADQVTVQTYRYFLGDAIGIPGILYTHLGDARGVGDPQHDLAMNNIVQHLEDYGLTVALEPVPYGGDTYYNVVATKLGTVDPDQEYIIGAHYDSVSNPGADDNASGTSLMLECARILSQYDSDYTIRFIAFTREEQGLHGSRDYVSAHGDDNIIAMISADMVAYDTGGNEARIYARDDSTLLNTLGAAIDEYGDGLSWFHAGWIGSSNHSPFDSGGFDAALLIESEVWSNPHYHSPADSVDTPGYINYEYAVRMTRSVVGYLVDHAGVNVAVDGLDFVYPHGLPEYLCGSAVRVEVVGVGSESPQPDTGMLHVNTRDGWLTIPMIQMSPNVYNAEFPTFECGTIIDYYFSAKSTTDQTYTDPYSAPAGSFEAMWGYGRHAFFSEPLDTDPSWTTEAAWAFGQPTGDGGEYGEADPTSGYTGPNVYGYNLAGDYANNIPEYDLTTPAINCIGQTEVALSFWRWLGVEKPMYDHAYVRVSNDGETWHTVWENAATIEDSEWRFIELDISPWADGKATVYVRWTMGTTDGGWRYCGWNIDDVQLTALRCEDSLCTGDMNCDGTIDFDDIDPFVAALGTSAGVGWPCDCPWLHADCNGDGSINFDDIDPFVARIGTTCP